MAWIAENLDTIYAGLPGMPVSAATSHRFFAAPDPDAQPDGGAPQQDRLLHLMGRMPA